MQELVQMINQNDGVEVTKRTTNWGTNTIPNYTMIAEHSQFLVDYYTSEGDLILDNFMGRGTNILAGLYHNRRVVGIDVNQENVEKLQEVCVKHFPEQLGNFELHQSCGVTLKEFEGQAEVFDAVVTDPRMSVWRKNMELTQEILVDSPTKLIWRALTSALRTSQG